MPIAARVVVEPYAWGYKLGSRVLGNDADLGWSIKTVEAADEDLRQRSDGECVERCMALERFDVRSFEEPPNTSSIGLFQPVPDSWVVFEIGAYCKVSPQAFVLY